MAHQRLRIRSLSELDAVVGECVIEETPSVHWEDSQGFFQFDSEEEAFRSRGDPYFQLFLPDLDWSQTVFVEVKSYQPYSSDPVSAIKVVEKLAGQGKKLTLDRNAGRWIAKFETASSAAAWSLPVAICAAGLIAIGIAFEIDPDMV